MGQSFPLSFSHDEGLLQMAILKSGEFASSEPALHVTLLMQLVPLQKPAAQKLPVRPQSLPQLSKTG